MTPDREREAELRDAALEEAAKICETLTMPTSWFQGHIQECRVPTNIELAIAIRAKKSGSSND